MRATRSAEQALRLASSSHVQQYVCKSCRAQAARQFSTSLRQLADEPFYKRLQNTLFGSKESREAATKREEKQRRRFEDQQSKRLESDEPETKVGRDGRQFEVAQLVDPKEYEQATNWDGLERMGSKEWVKAREDRGEQYVGFVPKKKIELSHREWEMLLHHIMVEVLVLQKAGHPAGEVCFPRKADADSWMYTRNATIMPHENGGVGLTFSDAMAEQLILEAIPQELEQDHVQDEQALIDEVSGAVAEGKLTGQKDGSGKRNYMTPPAWMDVSIRDQSIKMAVIKRTLQLTGKRLPDPAISTSNTLADLYNHLRTKPEVKKIFNAPQLQRLKVEAPNVQVYSNRRTPIHKEKEVGRWKVIEEELVKRDLPVTGSRWQGAKALVR